MFWVKHFLLCVPVPERIFFNKSSKTNSLYAKAFKTKPAIASYVTTAQTCVLKSAAKCSLLYVAEKTSKSRLQLVTDRS